MEISKLSYAILYDFLTFWQIFFQVLQFLVINILSDLRGYSTDSICNFVFRLSSISRSFTQKYHGSKIVASKNDKFLIWSHLCEVSTFSVSCHLYGFYLAHTICTPSHIILVSNSKLSLIMLITCSLFQVGHTL